MTTGRAWLSASASVVGPAFGDHDTAPAHERGDVVAPAEHGRARAHGAGETPPEARVAAAHDDEMQGQG